MDLPVAPCDIWIDKEGIWYYRGAEMFRRDIVRLFYKHLIKDASGKYLIEMDDDRCYVDVEDKAYVVKAVYRFDAENGSGESIYLLLSDDDLEKLEMETLTISESNIPYCSVKNRQFKARFSRASYYQLAQFIHHDPDRDAYFIPLNGHHHYLEYTGSRDA
jgi:hypothetical protein